MTGMTAAKIVRMESAIAIAHGFATGGVTGSAGVIFLLVQ